MSLAVVDLDGTVLDTRRRHSRCYERVMAGLGLEPLSPEDFWRARRRGPGWAAIAPNASDPAELARRWRALIEDESLVLTDVLQPGAKEALDRLRGLGTTVVICTSRQHPALATMQVHRLAIAHDLLVVSRSESKAGDLLTALPETPAVTAVWFGDTEADVNAAHELGLRAVAVSCGLRDEAYLRSLPGPLEICDSLADGVARLCEDKDRG